MIYLLDTFLRQFQPPIGSWCLLYRISIYFPSAFSVSFYLFLYFLIKKRLINTCFIYYSFIVHSQNVCVVFYWYVIIDTPREVCHPKTAKRAYILTHQVHDSVGKISIVENYWYEVYHFWYTFSIYTNR